MPGGGRGGDFFIENPGGGGGSPGWEVLRGQESVCGELGNFFAGANF